MTDALHLIALVGMPGSGKSIAADFFRDKGIPVLRFGDQTDIGLKEHGLERNEKNERWYREQLRVTLGMAAMAIKIEPRIREAAKSATKIVLDGLYSWEEFVYLKEKFPFITLVYIYASPAIRYERLSKRAIRPLSSQEAQSRDYAEIEFLNKGGPIAMADIVITNTQNKEQFIQALQEFYTTI